jgi:hypothetical protein
VSVLRFYPSTVTTTDAIYKCDAGECRFHYVISHLVSAGKSLFCMLFVWPLFLGHVIHGTPPLGSWIRCILAMSTRTDPWSLSPSPLPECVAQLAPGVPPRCVAGLLGAGRGDREGQGGR